MQRTEKTAPRAGGKLQPDQKPTDRRPFKKAELDQLFRSARSYNSWADAEVSLETIAELYELVKWGPTSANCSPARFLFVRSADAKARLAAHVSKANLPKVMQAPVTVVVAWDASFADQLPRLFPHSPGAASWFADPAVADETAMRNSSLQGAYMILAARALGLDCGPMSGFDRDGVDRTFFVGSSWRSNFLVNIGVGSPDGLFDRNPRLPFDDACQIV